MKKLVAGVVAAAMLMTMMSACSNPPATSSTGASSNPTSASSKVTEKINLVAPQLGYNDTQIATATKLADPNATETVNYYTSVRKSIEKDYPNYNVDYVDWGWGEQLDQKQRTLLSSGDAPSLVAGETFIPTYANEGILSPLPQDIVDSVNPSFLVYDANKKAVAVAYKSSTFMLFYNKDLIKKAGLDPENPPKTWSEWQKNSDAITKAGKGAYYGGGVPSFAGLGGGLRATPFFRQLSTDFGKDGKSNLSDANLKKTLQFIRDMNANLPAGVGNNSDESAMWNAFEKTQTIAYAINGSWQAFGATANKMNWGVAALPIADGGKDGNCMVGSVYLAVPKAAKNQDACFNLIREALKSDNLMHWIKNVVPVPLNSIINDTASYASDKTLTVAMGQIKSGTYSGLATFSKNNSAIWDIIDQKVLARTTMTTDSIDKICSDGETEINGLLK